MQPQIQWWKSSFCIALTQNCIHFLKIMFYSYYIHQGNKSDKERKIVRKKLDFMHIKRFNTIYKVWLQFHISIFWSVRFLQSVWFKKCFLHRVLQIVSIIIIYWNICWDKKLWRLIIWFNKRFVDFLLHIKIKNKSWNIYLLFLPYSIRQLNI